MRISLLRFAAFALALSAAAAAPANPNGRLYDQPDGSKTPLLFLKGDEHYSWKTDKKGFTVIQDERGWYVYAKKEDGDLLPTGVRVGYGSPKKLGLTPNLQTDPHKRPVSYLRDRHDLMREHRDLLNVPTAALCNFQGTKNSPCRLKGLVVLVHLRNHRQKNRRLPAPEEYDVLFNHNGPTTNSTAPTGSVADVFMANSYDSFVMETHITPWIAVQYTETETVDGNYGLNRPGTRRTWQNALEIVEQKGWNLGKYDEDGDNVIDSLVMMHSGASAETGGTDCETGVSDSGRIWSHQTAQTWFTGKTGIRNHMFYVCSGVWDSCPPGNTPYRKWDIARIAVIAHECAHFLGLPDLYDTTVGAGQGSFELQANMWGWYGTQYYPPLMGAWCKMHMGWVNVVTITHSGTYTMKPACTSNTVYKIDWNMPNNEYFLIEYRYPCGFDKELRHHSGDPSRDRHGAAVWHIDETGSNGNGFQSEGRPGDGQFPRRHYTVALAQSDGDWDLEKGLNRGDDSDLYRKSSKLPNVGYKIAPDGTTLNSGARNKYPNTNSYSTGVEKRTGITIEFGEPQSTMKMKVTLEGAPSQPDHTELDRTKTIPSECLAKKGTVCFKGVGKDPNKIYLKPCRFVKRVPDKVCNLDDLKRPGRLVKQRCAVACKGM